MINFKYVKQNTKFRSTVVSLKSVFLSHEDAVDFFHRMQQTDVTCPSHSTVQLLPLKK